MKFTAAGDMIIQRRIQKDFEGYGELTPYIESADARFFNLETTLNEIGECCGGQFSGGTYIRTSPRVLGDLEKFGFNMTSFNNNHAMDFAQGGLLSTLEALEDSDLVHAGVGRNMGDAAAPAYLDTKNGRVALIAVNSSFEPSMMAGEASERFPGRPGINGLRVNSYLRVTQEEMEFIRGLADRTGINVQKVIEAKEGYCALPKDDEANLGPMRFVLGEKDEFVSEIAQADIDRVKKAIFEAQLQADYVIVSVHSHQLSGDAKENPSQFLIDFAHTCIDSGANAVVGHGPHLLRPVEVYKDCPIFYSLGDFILQLYSVEAAPADFFAKQNMPFGTTVHELLAKRSANFTRGLMTDARMFLSVLPLWETEGGKLKSLRLVPIELSMDGHKSEVGLPRLASPEKVVKYLGDMSAPYGVKLEADADGLITCKW